MKGKGRTSRDHRSNFNLIAVVEYFVFGDEIIPFDDEMRFDDEIQLAQKLFDLLGTFDFDGSGWMAQLNLHGVDHKLPCKQGARGLP